MIGADCPLHRQGPPPRLAWVPDPVIFAADEPLALTGERTAPGIADENYWFQRHLIAYDFAARLVAGATVLDAGCGEGYGVDRLAGVARSATGIDLEEPVLARARSRYPEVGFVCGDLNRMPFPDAAFDALVSLQVIEHLSHPGGFLTECHRVLRPGGLVVLATPNRLTFSPDGVIRNPFHTIEFAPEELREAVAHRFDAVEMMGVFHGPRIRAWELVQRGSFVQRLIREPAPTWSPTLRRRIHSVGVHDFRLRATGLDRSLDLVAVARSR